MRTNSELQNDLKAVNDYLMDEGVSTNSETFMTLLQERARILCKIYTMNYKWENDGLGLAIPAHSYNPNQLPNGFKSVQ